MNHLPDKKNKGDDSAMALENAKKFMEELDSNEKALEILKAHEQTDEEQEVAVLASAARETGYDVSDEEMKELLTATKSHLVQAGDEAAAKVALSKEEIDKVAGGKDHDCCVDTFKDGENCWVNDSCKKFVTNYWQEDGDGNVTCYGTAFCDGVMRKHDCKFGRVGG
jgi:hypothetical protein